MVCPHISDVSIQNSVSIHVLYMPIQKIECVHTTIMVCPYSHILCVHKKCHGGSIQILHVHTKWCVHTLICVHTKYDSVSIHIHNMVCPYIHTIKCVHTHITVCPYMSLVSLQNVIVCPYMCYASISVLCVHTRLIWP